jgi:hypothetical protein
MNILITASGVEVMRKHQWQWVSTFVLLALLLSSAAGCIVIPVESSQKSTPIAPGETDGAGTLTASTRPAINSFEVRPEVISPGIPVTLSWDVSGAMSVNIQPDVGNVGPSGSQQLSPNSTATYTLTATNAAGGSTSQATVTVTAASSGTGATALVGSDPVSGRNGDIDLNWEQLCLASEYQMQIAKDPGFSIIVLDTGPFAPADSTSPGAYYPAGGKNTATAGLTPPSPLDRGISAIASPSVLEAGHTYYARIRVRQAATGQYMLSPWSEVYTFTVKSGLPTNADYYGPQLLHPSNGYKGCPVSPVSFSWTPAQDATKYKFTLAKDAALTDVLVEVEVPTTAYEYKGALDYNTSYFWRVMALEPVPSDWSATFTFQTEAAPAPPAAPTPPPATPLWAWVVIASGSIVVIAVVVLTILAHRK